MLNERELEDISHCNLLVQRQMSIKCIYKKYLTLSDTTWHLVINQLIYLLFREWVCRYIGNVLDHLDQKLQSQVEQCLSQRLSIILPMLNMTLLHVKQGPNACMHCFNVDIKNIAHYNLEILIKSPFIFSLMNNHPSR